MFTLFSTLNKNIQTVYGFEFYPQHQYKKISFNGNQIGKILNDISNCVITEKIVSFNTKNFLKTKQFQSPFYGLKLSENEPLALNSYHDFGILEKIINRKRILVRVDVSKSIGLGHVHNMLTILNHFRNEEILVVMNSKNNLGQKKFQEHLYKVKTFKTKSNLLKIIEQFDPHIIFNDILNTTVDYMNSISKTRPFLVNFEDLGNGRKHANLVFNPIYHSPKNSCNEHYGPNFACVRDEFRMWEPAKLRKIPQRVVIIFGGLDPTNKTYSVLKLIEKFQLQQMCYSIVIGHDYKAVSYTHLTLPTKRIV